MILFQYSHRGRLWWMVNDVLQRLRRTKACWITSNVCYLCKGWSRLWSGVRLCFGQLVCGRNMQCCFRRLREWQLVALMNLRSGGCLRSWCWYVFQWLFGCWLKVPRFKWKEVAEKHNSEVYSVVEQDRFSNFEASRLVQFSEFFELLVCRFSLRGKGSDSCRCGEA